MSDYIITYTGLHFTPSAPDPERICIEDIAHALSLICRGNGHEKQFYSVGEHCIYCAKEAAARGAERPVVLAYLLHDASECYLSDVPSPFKPKLPDYIGTEKKLLDIIYRRFLGRSLTEEEKKQVHEIDHACLQFDMTYLLGEPLEGVPMPSVFPEQYQVRPFEEVEREYLELFHQLKNE